MRELRHLQRDERGVTLILFALLVVTIFVFVAFAIDIGAVRNERRQDQTASDAASLTAVQSILAGKSIAAQRALDVARVNLDTKYSDAAWAHIWSTCTDPARPSEFGNVSTVSPCISFNYAFTKARVKIPDQLVNTNFARVINVNSLTARALAEAGLQRPGNSGVLPFPVNSQGNADGGEVCLKTPPKGQAIEPCTGSEQGNYGYLGSPWFGNTELGTGSTPSGCNTNPQGKQDTFVNNNIAVGIDHLLAPRGTNARRNDECYAPEVPNHLFTVTGTSDNVNFEPPLVGDTTYSDGKPARLKRSPQNVGPFGPFRSVAGESIDDTPLWKFIGSEVETDTNVPVECKPSYFATAPSKSKLNECFAAYNAAGITTPIFTRHTIDSSAATYDIQYSGRFAFVPESNDDLKKCTGNCEFDIKRFRAVFIQSLYYNKGDAFDPGEVWTAAPSGTLLGMSAFMFKDSMLPPTVVASGPSGTLLGMKIALVK